MAPSHLFLIDPLESLNRDLDSSLRLMFELKASGHEVLVAEPRQLAWHSGTTGAMARCRPLTFKGDAKTFAPGEPENRHLPSFSAIHMRKDPPYDMEYIATTWLLDTATRTTRVYNAPSALRTYNEKLAILRFPAETKPALVSSNAGELMRFVEKEAKGDAILKPLTLFGGRGVERLELAKGKELVEAKLQEETAKGTQLRLIQGFDKAIYEGEVRVFTAFGEPIAWCLKKPASGNYLANTRAGAVLSSYEPTKAEVDRVTRVARTLLAAGVVFIGFDMIGGYLSEINITSPRLLTPPGDKKPYYRQLAKAVTADLDV